MGLPDGAQLQSVSPSEASDGFPRARGGDQDSPRELLVDHRVDDCGEHQGLTLPHGATWYEPCIVLLGRVGRPLEDIAFIILIRGGWMMRGSNHWHRGSSTWRKRMPQANPEPLGALPTPKIRASRLLRVMSPSSVGPNARTLGSGYSVFNEGPDHWEEAVKEGG